MSNVMRGKFWERTGFVTKEFDEMVIWISVLKDKGFRFAMTYNNYGNGEGYYVFAVNVNSLIAADLVKTEGFHDEFPIVKGGF